MIEVDKNIQKVVILGVLVDIMGFIIDFVYIVDVVVMLDNIECLFLVVDQFYVLGFVKLCCSFFEFYLIVLNCIGVCWIVKMYGCLNLEKVVF